MRKGIALCGPLLGVFLLAITPVWSQRLDHVQGEILVQLRPGANIHSLGSLSSSLAPSQTSFQIRRQIQPFPIWVCTFDFASVHERDLLEELRRNPLVEHAQFNHFLDKRSTIPNDPLFFRQWQYINTGQSGGRPGADLDMELVWDITQGGVTKTGDTIVICVIDEGLDLSHEDFGTNRWVNREEVPGNRIDDDGNGYVDDYLGWNTLYNNDNINVDVNHGTPVSGIIGAKGNNGVGVAGVNWNVKLMIVAGGIGLESEAIAAYAYPLIQRRRYNASNGREGAFVVATNASWGADFGDPDDFPLWCGLYDTLGAAGILNVAATADKEIDVDVQGDMPTACPSDYLIAVTTSDDSGKRARGFGFGATTIDLATYGEETFTTATGNRYGPFGGTSAAAPHVTGAIGLLYANDCPTLMAVAQSDPGAAARLVKKYLLQSVTPEPTFEGRTLTGGLLNIYQALDQLLADCSSCPPPTSLDVSQVTDQEASLRWQINDSIRQVDLRWRQVGSSEWQLVRNPLTSFRLTGLSACTDYEFQIRAYCRKEQLDFSPSRIFRTDGCCDPPSRLRLSSFNDRTAVVQWQGLLAANQYRLRIRRRGEEEWKEYLTGRTIHFFNNLDPCTEYEVVIQTICTGGPTDYAPPLMFRTLGCGACLDLIYCRPQFINSSAEWIAQVSLNTLEYSSGSNNGYGDFTGMATTELVAGQSYPIRLQAGFAGLDQFEYFLVWIDLNQNGYFEDQELVFDPKGVTRNSVSGTVAIPANSSLGSTRMRVAMRYFRPGGPCTFLDQGYGEIEDYCVTIVKQSTPCQGTVALAATVVSGSTVDLKWTDQAGPGRTYQLRYRRRNTLDWQHIDATGSAIQLSTLERCTDYEVQIKPVCEGILGVFSPSVFFKTGCSTAVSEPATAIVEAGVYPNPAHKSASVRVSLRTPQSSLHLILYSVNGRRLWEKEYMLSTGEHEVPLDLTGLPPGVYFLCLMPEQGRTHVLRILKSGD